MKRADNRPQQAAEYENLKSKEPRLRDWNSSLSHCHRVKPKLEIKRTSITRLKRYAWSFIVTKVNSWNQKNLDYEIETGLSLQLALQKHCHLKSKEPRLRDWNWHNTILNHRYLSYTWNQKNLDYEIETRLLDRSAAQAQNFLKSKEPRLRDWNYHNRRCLQEHITLKSKEPRLRDWNIIRGSDNASDLCFPWNQKNLDYEIETCARFWLKIFEALLEIKRTSITRLKQVNIGSRRGGEATLKSKEPRLRDWN